MTLLFPSKTADAEYLPVKWCHHYRRSHPFWQPDHKPDSSKVLLYSYENHRWTVFCNDPVHNLRHSWRLPDIHPGYVILQILYLTCPECGMELYTGIHSLLVTDKNGKATIRHNGRCRKFRAHKSDNNLVKCYPQVVEWWDYEKNNLHKPEDYTLYSPQSAYFKCPDCGLETYRRITDVFWTTLDGIPSLFRCSYCNNTKVFVGYNDLQTLCPELAKEWSEKNERSPQTVRRDTAVRAWWKCPVCNGEYIYRSGSRSNP